MSSLTEIVDSPWGKQIMLSHDHNAQRRRDGLWGHDGEIVLVREWLRKEKDPIFYDVGAHTGLFSLAVRDLCKYVFAWEPQRFVFNILTGNIALNSILNIFAFWAALGNEIKPIPMPTYDYEKSSNFGGIEFGKRYEPKGGSVGQSPSAWNGEYVMMKKLDSYSFTGATVIKIDAEGMEVEVLEGAKDILISYHPKLLIEHVKVGADTLENYLRDRGYRNFMDLGGDLACEP